MVTFIPGAPPSECPGMRAARGGWGQGAALGVGACRGSTLGRWPMPPLAARRSGTCPLSTGSSPWPLPTVPPATRFAAFALCSAAAGGAAGLLGALHPSSTAVGGLLFVGAGGGGPGQRLVVSDQRVRETPLPRAPVRSAPPAGACLAVSLPVCPRPWWPPGSGVTPFSHMSCCADGWGVEGCSGPGGVGLPGGALLGVRRQGSEARPPGRRAIAFGLGRYLRLCLCGGWGCGGRGLLGQERQWPRAARRDRGSQSLASASVMQGTTPPSRKAGLPGPWFGHPAQITARRTLSWSSRATHPPVGTFWFRKFLCCLSCCLLLV